MNTLVTGVAGYIGSVVAQQLLEAGHAVVGLDDLSQGHLQAVLPSVTFVQGDVNNSGLVASLLREHHVDVVLHLAADAVVGRSITDPGHTFRANMAGGLSLLEAMVETGVPNIVFSSTASVYGHGAREPITEQHPSVPISAYGESKLMMERMLHWFNQAHGINSISLRYFNASGATAELGEDHRPETHLLPAMFNVALGQSPMLPIFGDSFPTADGSTVRDYIHVVDIATAHLLAMEHINQAGCRAYNLGSGQGHSVLEVVEMVRRVTGKDVPTQTQDPRPGDPAVLVAGNQLAKRELGWRPFHSSLQAIVESAWQWRQGHPHGYE
jgi:UDP-glucose 4-epimerase